ncbi:IclR family transcriptional regulator [Pseudoclavibacter endophyticus]|uniref:IclR family transcriptional regulator n=1 Tax=Pseudoclavibacter endophyticus TaxID=1778590 RepID=A0A6H9WD89_9MICO|nr:IclR family transcriptional regulator [Pseudoclavibacter endophyticus]KAB1648922.1 IclR family transcriptional regulator [Pseudoclavibacter endophyticus]GGA67206.1 IclR family transcriptional regulator [Pseudoclavibacter endophyticus]
MAIDDASPSADAVPSADTSSEPRGRYTIDAVDNAARILLMLAERPWLRTSDVANELGVARSTAHRMVSTLLERGLLRYNPGDKSYGAGYRLVELGMSVIGVGDLKSEAIPFLAQVAAMTGETAHLIVLEGDEIVFVSVAEGGHVIRAASRVGARVPAHATAAGKCLLAQLSPAEFDQLYPSATLAPATDATIRSRVALVETLDTVRAQGFAVNDGESESELAAVSAPIIDTRGTAHGAISISGPKERVRAARERYVDAVVSATRGLERKIFGRAS